MNLTPPLASEELPCFSNRNVYHRSGLESVAPQMLKLETHVCVLALFGCFSAVACGGGGGGAPTTPSTTVTALAIAGSPTAAALGQSVSLILTATLSSGSIQIVTAQAAWQSSNSAVATVSSAGVVTTVWYGSAIITATYQGMTAQFTFTVTLAGA